MARKWTEPEDARLRELRSAGLDSGAIADEMGRTFDSVQSRCQRLRLPITTAPQPMPTTRHDEKKLLRKELELANDRLDKALKALEQERRRKAVRFGKPRSGKSRGGIVRVTFGDTHGMRVDKEAFAAVVADLEVIQPNELICMGDHVDCDGHLTAHKPIGYTSLSDYSYDEDCNAAATMLDHVQKACKPARFDYLEGNHEERVRSWCKDNARNDRDQKMNERLYLPASVLELEGRGIHFHATKVAHDGLSMLGAIRRGKCLFVHGFSHAKRAAEVHVQAVATNIVFAHTHRAEEYRTSTESTGPIGAWNPGCLCQRHQMYNHSRPSGWTHGYGLQFISPGGEFLHLNVPIIGGRSYLTPLLKVLKA